MFTLGLTEAWRAKADGAVFPLPPGVAGGAMDFDHYEFVNFGVEEVIVDLESFLDRLAQVNPGARVILTVSPVPLAATSADRHVLVSTTYSKSVLRVAAEQVAWRRAGCEYFPAYEVITGNFNRGVYYAADLRSVTAAGVDHVMRLFFRHYATSPGGGTIDPQLLTEARKLAAATCDEELLAAAAR